MCFGRPIEAYEDKIKILIETNRRIIFIRNCYEIEFIEFDCSWSHEMALFHSEYLGSTYSSYWYLWFTKHKQNDSFLKRIIIGNEK